MLWNKSFLSQKWVLWSLFGFNLVGTIYGYIWYGNQIVYTIYQMVPWYVIFVPDSPTASLFFTLALGYLLMDSYRTTAKPGSLRTNTPLRGVIEAFAVITLFKYGIWAVAMIAAAGLQGDVISWQDWMLIVSHSAMAIEGLLFLQLFRIQLWHIALVSAWTLANDMMDYSAGIFPWLPKQLHDDLTLVEGFTLLLSWISIGLTYFGYKQGLRK